MDHERQDTQSRKDYYEEFRILRNSDFWPCLPQKTQRGIMSLLGEERLKEVKDKQQ